MKTNEFKVYKLNPNINSLRFLKLRSTYTNRWGARAIYQSKDYFMMGGSIASSVNSDAFTPLIARFRRFTQLDNVYELRDTSSTAPWYSVDLIGFSSYQLRHRNGRIEYMMNATPRDANFLPMGNHLAHLFIIFRPGPSDFDRSKWGDSCDDVSVMRWWPQGTGTKTKYLIPLIITPYSSHDTWIYFQEVDELAHAKYLGGEHNVLLRGFVVP